MYFVLHYSSSLSTAESPYHLISLLVSHFSCLPSSFLHLSPLSATSTVLFSVFNMPSYFHCSSSSFCHSYLPPVSLYSSPSKLHKLKAFFYHNAAPETTATIVAL